MIQNLPLSEAIGWAAMADLARLMTVGLFALNAFFLRDIYRDFKALREDVYGKGGLNERLSHLEGVQEAQR